MLEGSIFEGSMSGRADAWMGRCLEEQPDAVGVLLGSTSGSAVHRALSQARPPPGIPLPGCRRPALGIRLQIPEHPAVPAGHGQIRADRRAFPVERTFGAKLQAAFKPADKAPLCPVFRGFSQRTSGLEVHAATGPVAPCNGQVNRQILSSVEKRTYPAEFLRLIVLQICRLGPCRRAMASPHAGSP